MEIHSELENTNSPGSRAVPYCQGNSVADIMHKQKQLGFLEPSQHVGFVLKDALA